MENTLFPADHQALMPYLIVENADQFLAFLQRVFGATEIYRALREDGKIMHAEMQVNGSTLMLAEANDQWSVQAAGMFVYVASADEAYYKALGEGATAIMNLSDKEYGRTCGVKDPFGNTWWITSGSGAAE